jgi:hypothetical protein
MAAMERLADVITSLRGKRRISVWTDSDGSTLDHVSNDCYEDENIGSLQFAFMHGPQRRT